MSQQPSHNYTTIYDFCKRNRVECTMSPNGTYNCYINYVNNQAPDGYGPNILDAIENGVINFIRRNNMTSMISAHEEDAQTLRKNFVDFINKQAKMFWYYFGLKHKNQAVIDYYEQLAEEQHPSFKKFLIIIANSVDKTVDDIHYKINNETPAIHNMWTMVLVYYESFLKEKYENCAVIRDILKSYPEEDIKAFHLMQTGLSEIETEVSKMNNE